MEITGFTDENIKNYVETFFDQMKKELDHALLKSEKLFSFLKSNSSIWGVAHIPVNLELICSLWINEDRSETVQLTMTTLYTMMTEWLCRRYLRTQDNKISQLPQHEIEQYCQKELAFLEILAFNYTTCLTTKGMERSKSLLTGSSTYTEYRYFKKFSPKRNRQPNSDKQRSLLCSSKFSRIFCSTILDQCSEKI
jgi:hypothetical protein